MPKSEDEPLSKLLVSYEAPRLSCFCVWSSAARCYVRVLVVCLGVVVVVLLLGVAWVESCVVVCCVVLCHAVLTCDRCKGLEELVKGSYPRVGKMMEKGVGGGC